MTLSLIALLLGGIALPHMLRLDRSTPMAAAMM